MASSLLSTQTEEQKERGGPGNEASGCTCSLYMSGEP